jgi:hypothetical protein
LSKHTSSTSASFSTTSHRPSSSWYPYTKSTETASGQFEHYGADDLLSALWISFYESKRHYYCQICCDGDSFLLTPDGRRLYHKGYPGPRFPFRNFSFQLSTFNFPVPSTLNGFPPAATSPVTSPGSACPPPVPPATPTPSISPAATTNNPAPSPLSTFPLSPFRSH